jgi:aminoglycoside adenylyltransferase-like protein/nucleotidyltransferase-like protein
VDSSARGYLEALTAEVATVVGDRLVGVYAHGSLLLGGYLPERSDVDVLVVVEDALSTHEQATIAGRLSEEALPCPAVGLELSIVTRASAAAPSARPAFELHVTTAPADVKVVDGHRHPGDPDLVLHFAVCRRLAAEVFAEVPRSLVLAQLADELVWAVEHAAPEYAVLNACRARRYAADGVLVSKVDGGRWALTRLTEPERTLVDAALARQTGTEPTAPIDLEAAPSFVMSARAVIRNEAYGPRFG